MTRARDLSKLLGTNNNGVIPNSNLGVSFENISDTGTQGTKVATGTTAQRGSTTGQIRFNTTTGLAEYYTGTEFKIIDSPPTVTAVSPLEVASDAGGNITFTITGSNFNSGAVVKFIGNDATELTASTTTVNSSSSISAVIARSSFVNAKEPYDVRVINTSGLAGTLDNQINVDSSPTWSTASGSLGSFQEGDSVNISVSATDAEGDTVSYSVLSGSLPSGLSLNSSTGAITGTAPIVTSNTTSSFTLRATANSKTADRAFSITVTLNVETFAFTSTGTSTWTVPASKTGKTAEILVVAGGGGGGRAGGGGAGGVLHHTSFVLSSASYSITVGSGGTGWTLDSDQSSSQRGGDSFFGSLQAFGGGGGAYSGVNGFSGGSGGGHGFNGTFSGGASTQTSNNGGTGYGNAGASGNSGGNNSGGGGGGASFSGSAGNSDATGGAGKLFSNFTSYGTNASNGITGSRGYFAGGGGGDNHTSTRIAGGVGGGGTGSGGNSGVDATGRANTGGGGGAGHHNAGTSTNNNGGSGIVLVRV